MLKAKYRNLLKQKPVKNFLKEKFQNLRKKLKGNTVDSKFVQLGNQDRLIQYHYTCKLKGRVNHDQCFFCFTQKLEKQTHATRVLCKRDNVTLDEAQEERDRKQNEALHIEEENRKQERIKVQKRRELFQKLRKQK